MELTRITRATDSNLPPLPYGAANGFAGAGGALSDAINRVHEHCRQIEWRRMAIALRKFNPCAA